MSICSQQLYTENSQDTGIYDIYKCLIHDRSVFCGKGTLSQQNVKFIIIAATDPARFEDNGISYRAKIIGIEDVSEARGDKMCQETIQKLKGAVKTSGQHKPRIFINVTLEGLKIIDGTALVSLVL